MAKVPGYPNVRAYEDQHGTTRYQFRKTGMRPATIPGQPGTAPFDDAYQAAIEGRIVQTAQVVAMPGAANPASLDACWLKVQTTAKWKKLQLESQQLYSRIVEQFLNEPLPGGKIRAGLGPVADLRPRHIAEALDAWSDTPTKARLLLVVLQKMMKVAVREEWRDTDPTATVEKPEVESTSKEAWPSHVCARYELRHPIGSPARTAYELAKWLGIRRSDVALVRWDQMVTAIENGEAVEGFKFVQYKGRNRKGAYARFHAIPPMLGDYLAQLDRSAETILARQDGQPYNIDGLTTAMWKWTAQAGVPKGYSFHGLRHAMGAMLADSDASDVQTQDVLGHATISQQNIYKKGRNQTRSAIGGMKAVTRLVRGAK